MEYATLIFALPVTIVAYFVMASFSKVLRMERAEREGRAQRRRTVSAVGGNVPERSWRQRLASFRAYPSQKTVDQFMERVIKPALQDVTKEFTAQGYRAELTDYALQIHIDDHRDFLYQPAPVRTPMPAFGGRISAGTDVYYRIEVFTHTGAAGYDIYGLTHQQIIDDVLDRYEAHLGFLRYSSDHSYASVLTPDSTTTLPVTSGDTSEN